MLPSAGSDLRVSGAEESCSRDPGLGLVAAMADDLRDAADLRDVYTRVRRLERALSKALDHLRNDTASQDLVREIARGRDRSRTTIQRIRRTAAIAERRGLVQGRADYVILSL